MLVSLLISGFVAGLLSLHVICRAGLSPLGAGVVNLSPFLGFRLPYRTIRPAQRIRRSASNGDAAPRVWNAGPAEVHSGQAQMALDLLKENPMLFDSNLEKALEALHEQLQRDALQRIELNGTAKDDNLILRRRMNEVRQSERKRVVTELLYLKVCDKFRWLRIPLVPSLKSGGNVTFDSIDVKDLTTDLHSEGALELISEKLSSLIGEKGTTTSSVGSMSGIKVALFQAGQLYASSASFGYDLRQCDKRHQLEKLAGTNCFAVNGSTHRSLKDYISSFTPEDLSHLTDASVEGQKVMESQISALFGDMGALQKKIERVLGHAGSKKELIYKLQSAIKNNEVDTLRLTNTDFRRLVLEALAFGALLYDAERQMDLIYALTPSLRKRPLFGSNRNGGAANFYRADK